MPIAMERFGATDHFLTLRHPCKAETPESPYRLQCRECGFEPIDVGTTPPRCPKCASHAWERFAVPRSLLMRAERYPMADDRTAADDSGSAAAELTGQAK